MADHEADAEPAAKRLRTFTDPAEFAPPAQGSSEPRGKVLFFSNASDITSRNELNAACAQHGEVAYVDFKYGDTTGYVRFKRHDGAQAALEQLQAKPVTIANATPAWRLLSAEEAAAYNKRRGETEQRDKAKAERKASKPERPVLHGVVLRFEGASENTNRNDLLAACSQGGGDVAFVDFRFGDTSGAVRFKTAEGCQAALQALQGGAVEISGQVPSWRLLSEEEEDAYRSAVQAKKSGASGSGSAASVPATPAGAPAGAASLEPSLVVHFDGVGPDASREAVTEACAAHGEIAFVDFRWGATEGYVRFKSAEGARVAATALAGSSAVGVGGAVPRWRLLTDTEAEAYRVEVQAKKRAKGEHGKGGRQAPRGWGGFGGRGRGHGRF